MSETVTVEVTTAPQSGGAPPESAATTDEGTAPADTGAATETTETTEEQPKPSRGDRRIAALSAKLSAAVAEIDRLRQPPAPPQQYEQQWTPEQQAAIRAEAQKLAAQDRVQARVEAFHEAGRAAHPDWNERCQSLMQMGADAPFAELLVETPDGARVAAALADDPEELERITGLKTERARAIALGKYAAAMEAKPATPARRVSNAPAPIRPVGGSARVEPNEYTMDTNQLVDFYSKQAMAAQRGR